MFNKHRQETLIYVVLWGLLFIAPVLSLYIRTAGDSSLDPDWSEVTMVWRQYGVFFAVFLIHNHLLAPQLVYRQRKVLYFTVAAVLVASFTLYQCTTGPAGPRHRGPRHEMKDGHRPPEYDGKRPALPDFDGRRPTPPDFGDERPAPSAFDGRHPTPPDDVRPPLVLGQHDIIAVIVLLLMLGANLGIKLYFKQQRDQQRLSAQEHKNLEQQLAYLKYQLNPHFLMNTLNNIHALVDIDPEHSKEAIIQLSKILRYVLYDSNHERVPITKEREFMENYIQLMRMRYTDKLRFSVSYPDDGAGFSVPPLLFISFVENAFKHGVSYQKESFISISSERIKGRHGEDRLLWTCRNSKHCQPDAATIPRQGGVGMANVRQRLDIIYGDDYTLGINETSDTYEVILNIPL